MLFQEPIRAMGEPCEQCDEYDKQYKSVRYSNVAKNGDIFIIRLIDNYSN